MIRNFNSIEFIVATNDRKYSSALLRTKKIKFTASRDPLDDFILIAKAKFKILSNSTFAWWAAEVGDSGTQIVEVNPYYKNIKWNPQSIHARILIVRN